MSVVSHMAINSLMYVDDTDLILTADEGDLQQDLHRKSTNPHKEMVHSAMDNRWLFTPRKILVVHHRFFLGQER